MLRTDLFVTGYPRSGNTWLARLLGDVLNSPVGGMYYAKPLATEGLQRPGRYYVRQLHLRPTQADKGKPVPNAWTLSLPYLDEIKLLHVVRDPRDVIVSVFYYWQIETLQKAIDAVCYGLDPIKVHGPWGWALENWLAIPGVPMVRYEDLTRNTRGVLQQTLDTLGVSYREDALDGAIERQAFAAKKQQVERDGASRPYGRTIQLRHLRKGIVGDYKNHMTQAQIEQVWDTCHEAMERLGYERGF